MTGVPAAPGQRGPGRSARRPSTAVRPIQADFEAKTAADKRADFVENARFH